jgi:hypothetical protein
MNGFLLHVQGSYYRHKEVALSLTRINSMAMDGLTRHDSTRTALCRFEVHLDSWSRTSEETICDSSSPTFKETMGPPFQVPHRSRVGSSKVSFRACMTRLHRQCLALARYHAAILEEPGAGRLPPRLPPARAPAPLPQAGHWQRRRRRALRAPLQIHHAGLRARGGERDHAPPAVRRRRGPRAKRRPKHGLPGRPGRTWCCRSCSTGS